MLGIRVADCGGHNPFFSGFALEFGVKGHFKRAVSPAWVEGDDAMYDWSKLKNFRLARGSHTDPSGGEVCLVEAALLHGGFRYRAIRTAHDAPTCFSWIITHYAISLTDQMPDDLRQELLLPFVGRLAWTRRDNATEQRRLKCLIRKIDITGWEAKSVMLDNHPVRRRAYFVGAADALDEAISLGTPDSEVNRDLLDDRRRISLAR